MPLSKLNSHSEVTESFSPFFLFYWKSTVHLFCRIAKPSIQYLVFYECDNYKIRKNH